MLRSAPSGDILSQKLPIATRLVAVDAVFDVIFCAQIVRLSRERGRRSTAETLWRGHLMSAKSGLNSAIAIKSMLERCQKTL